MDKVMRFRLSISADEYLPYYRGQIREIQLRAEDGRQLRFPASAIRPFLSHDGIHGRFEIRFDASNRLLGIERIQ